MPDTPIILSLAIPAFKPEFFEETLACLVPQLVAGVELIVKDDSPDERIESMVRRYEGQGTIRYIRNETHLGMVDNWNSCFELMRGRYGFLLSDDDLLSRQAIAAILEALATRPQCGALLFRRVMFTQSETLRDWETSADSPYALCTLEPEDLARHAQTVWKHDCLRPYFGNVVFKLESLRAAGLYPTCQFSWGTDTAVGVQELLKGGGVLLQNVFLFWRSSPLNVSSSKLPLLFFPDFVVSKRLMEQACTRCAADEATKQKMQAMVAGIMGDMWRYTLCSLYLPHYSFGQALLHAWRAGYGFSWLLPLWRAWRDLGLSRGTIVRLLGSNALGINTRQARREEELRAGTPFEQLCPKWAQATTLYVAHHYGGGSAAYLRQRINEQKGLSICVKYSASFCFLLELYQDGEMLESTTLPNLTSLQEWLLGLGLELVVINGLICWPHVGRALEMLRALKAARSCKLVHLLHDYHCLNPRFDLLDVEGRFAPDASAEVGDYVSDLQELCCCDRLDLDAWRESWGGFFNEVVDEVVAFSESSRELFTRVYPQALDKVVVCPHVCPALRPAYVPPHEGLRIACLGLMNANKGAAIVRELAQLIEHDPQVSLIIVGSMDNAPEGVLCTGSYKRDELPLIMEANAVDVVLVPSICPETFSYTTQEAMLMGLPVACFELGAPAERVSQYVKGIIIPEMTAICALECIKQALARS